MRDYPSGGFGRRSVQTSIHDKVRDLALPQEERVLRSAYHTGSSVGLVLPGLTPDSKSNRYNRNYTNGQSSSQDAAARAYDLDVVR